MVVDRPTRLARIDATDLSFLQLWLHGRPATTRKAYARVATDFLDGVAKPLHAVSIGDLQDYVDRIARRSSVSTVRAHIYALRSMSRFAFRIDHVKRDLASILIVPAKNTDPNEKVLTQEHTYALIAAPRSQRHRILLRTLYLTGARVSEISRLRFADVTDHDTGGTVWITRKGGRRDGVWIPRPLLAELRSLKPVDGTPATFVFRGQGSNDQLKPRGIGRMVQRYARAAGFGNVSPHWLRHCHVSHAIARGAPIALVQKTVGHASGATTLVYAHSAAGDSSARFLI